MSQQHFPLHQGSQHHDSELPMMQQQQQDNRAASSLYRSFALCPANDDASSTEGGSHHCSYDVTVSSSLAALSSTGNFLDGQTAENSLNPFDVRGVEQQQGIQQLAHQESSFITTPLMSQLFPTLLPLQIDRGVSANPNKEQPSQDGTNMIKKKAAAEACGTNSDSRAFSGHNNSTRNSNSDVTISLIGEESLANPSISGGAAVLLRHEMSSTTAGPPPPAATPPLLPLLPPAPSSSSPSSRCEAGEVMGTLSHITPSLTQAPVVLPTPAIVAPSTTSPSLTVPSSTGNFLDDGQSAEKSLPRFGLQGMWKQQRETQWSLEDQQKSFVTTPLMSQLFPTLPQQIDVGVSAEPHIDHTVFCNRTNKITETTVAKLSSTNNDNIKACSNKNRKSNCNATLSLIAEALASPSFSAAAVVPLQSMMSSAADGPPPPTATPPLPTSPSSSACLLQSEAGETTSAPSCSPLALTEALIVPPPTISPPSTALPPVAFIKVHPPVLGGSKKRGPPPLLLQTKSTAVVEPSMIAVDLSSFDRTIKKPKRTTTHHHLVAGNKVICSGKKSPLSPKVINADTSCKEECIGKEGSGGRNMPSMGFMYQRVVASQMPSRQSSEQRKCSKDEASAPGTSHSRSSTTSLCSNLSAWVTSPQEHLTSLLITRGFPPDYCAAVSVPSLSLRYRTPSTPLQLASYGLSFLRAARSCDVKVLRDMLRSGLSRDPCNFHGDSVLGMACRRGDGSVVRCLLEEGGSVYVADDLGRTPLHHAAWGTGQGGGTGSCYDGLRTDLLSSSTAATSRDTAANKWCDFDAVSAVLERDPSLLLVSDSAGRTPLDHVPRGRWGRWREYLEDVVINQYFPEQEASSSLSTARGAEGVMGAKPLSWRPRRMDRASVPDPEGALDVETAAKLASGKIGVEEAREGGRGVSATRRQNWGGTETPPENWAE